MLARSVVLVARHGWLVALTVLGVAVLQLLVLYLLYYLIQQRVIYTTIDPLGIQPLRHSNFVLYPAALIIVLTAGLYALYARRLTAPGHTYATPQVLARIFLYVVIAVLAWRFAGWLSAKLESWAPPEPASGAEFVIGFFARFLVRALIDAGVALALAQYVPAAMIAPRDVRIASIWGSERRTLAKIFAAFLLVNYIFEIINFLVLGLFYKNIGAAVSARFAIPPHESGIVAEILVRAVVWPPLSFLNAALGIELFREARNRASAVFD